VHRGNAAAMLAEAERARPACPAGATFAWAYTTRALTALGRYDAAAARRHMPKDLVVD
jgi:hypothetical protein